MCNKVLAFCLATPPPKKKTAFLSFLILGSDIHIDIMDYIVPASCTDTEFRQMWAEFEWENKVSVNTAIADVNEYLEHLLSSTNMRCLTPKQALAGE